MKSELQNGIYTVCIKGYENKHTVVSMHTSQKRAEYFWNNAQKQITLTAWEKKRVTRRPINFQ